MKTLAAPAPQVIQLQQTIYRGSTEYTVIRVGKNKHQCARMVEGKRKCEWIPVEELSTNPPDRHDDHNGDRNFSTIGEVDHFIDDAQDSTPVSDNGNDNGHSPTISTADVFPRAFELECVEGSGIHPDLFKCATTIINEMESTDGGDPVLAIHEALGWRQDRYRRFPHNISESQQAGAFICEDGRVWQCKLKFPLNDEKGKPRKYESPTWEVSGGSRAYLPEIPAVIRDRISHRWGIPVPHDGSFWQWLAKTPIVPIVISEGGKKGLAGFTQGAVTIALNGCFGGVVSKDDRGRAVEPTLIKDLQPFLRGGRVVYLAFDKDTNPKTVADVKAATNRLGAVMEKSGCTVKLMEWDKSQGKGLDDYLVGGGSMDELLDTAQSHDFFGGECKSKAKKILRLMEEAFGDRIRLNEMAASFELDGVRLDIDEFFLDVIDQFDIDIAEGKAARIASRIAKRNSYSPVRDYLNNLPPGDPSFLNDLARRYLGNDTPLAAKLLRRTLIAAVARVYQPGCQHDGFTVFHGKQGVGKSTFWRTLGGNWFTDNLSKKNETTEKLQLRKYWIIEYSEFESCFKAKDISEMKEFISCQVDSMKPLYKRQVEDFPRTCLMVGTTNKNEFLRDPSGERRYWVIPVKQRIPIAEVERDREAIWAAARTAYLEGERWHLTFEEEAELMEATKVWKEVDPWEEDLINIIEGRKEITLSEIFRALDIQTSLKDSRSTRRITSILQGMGWESGKYSSGTNKGKRYWFFSDDYSAPTATQELEASDSNKDSGGTVSTKVLPPQCHSLPPQNDRSSPPTPEEKPGGTTNSSGVALQNGCSATAESPSNKGFQETVALGALKNGKKLSQKNPNLPSPTPGDLEGIVVMLRTFSGEGVLTCEAMQEVTAALSKDQKAWVWQALDEVDRHRLKQLTTPTIGKWYEHRGQLYECIGHYPGGRGEFLSRDGKTHGALVGDYKEVDYEPYFDSKDIVRVKAEFLPECQRRYGVEEGWTYSPDRHTTPDRKVVDVRRLNKRVGQKEKYNFPFPALELVRD